MSKAIKFIIILLCVPLLVLGLPSMFNPMMPQVLEKISLIPDANNTIKGLNTIRGIVGGLLLGSVAMMLIGLWKKNTTWYLANAVLMGIAVLGRIVGLVIDGFNSAFMPPLIIEIVIAVVMVLAHNKLKDEYSKND